MNYALEKNEAYGKLHHGKKSGVLVKLTCTLEEEEKFILLCLLYWYTRTWSNVIHLMNKHHSTWSFELYIL